MQSGQQPRSKGLNSNHSEAAFTYRSSGDGSRRKLGRKTSHQGRSIWWALEGLEPGEADITEKLKKDHDKQEHEIPCTILHPQSRFRVCWDFVVLILLLYFMFSVPFRLCFLDTQLVDDSECLKFGHDESCQFAKCTWNNKSGKCRENASRVYLFWWDTIVDVFFAVDICLNFRTAFFAVDDQANQKLVTSGGAIARRYLRSWFFFDLAGSIPLDLLLEVAAQADPGSNDSMLASLPRLLRFAKIFRLLKLVRAARIGNIAEKLEESANVKPEVFRVLQFLFVFSLVSHVLSCVLFALGTMGENFVCSRPGLLCTDQMAEAGESISWISNTVIVSRVIKQDGGEVSVKDAPFDTQYMMSMYWAITIMTTVGFGDIQPVTSWEVVTVIFSMLIGATTFSYVVGNMASLISKLDGHAGDFKLKMDQTTVFMHVNSVPKDLKNRIRKYYDYSFNHPQVDLNSTPLSDLSPALRLELLRFFRKNILTNVTLFRAIKDSDHDRFFSSLLECIVPIQRGPGDYIFHAGELGKDVYFVISGEVDMIEPETREITASLRKGSYFGENALVPGQERRTFTVRSRSWCDMLALSARDLKVVLQNFPESESMIRVTARLRWARLQSAIEAHQVVSRARGRAAVVTGQTLVMMMSKMRTEPRGGMEEDGEEGGEVEVEEDRSMTRQEAELLGDLRASVLASDMGRQLATKVRAVSGREWDWSWDWVDGDSVLEEARQLVSDEGGDGALAEKTLIRRLKDNGRKTSTWSDDDVAAWGRGGGDGGDVAPGIELERTLVEAAQRLEVMERETRGWAVTQQQVNALNALLRPLVKATPSPAPHCEEKAPNRAMLLVPPSVTLTEGSQEEAVPDVLATAAGQGATETGGVVRRGGDAERRYLGDPEIEEEEEDDDDDDEEEEGSGLDKKPAEI